MNIIHDVNNTTLPRIVFDGLLERLSVMPAVVVTGARQTGKSTLVQKFFGDRKYYTLDDLDVREAARKEPEILTDGRLPLTVDEVQREPDLLHSVKRSIDNNRQPGRFLLTGSANLLLMRKVSESLAGRASYMTLWPMTRREQQGLGKCGLWSELLETDEKDWIDLLRAENSKSEDWKGLAKRGGFPTPAIHLKNETERNIWFDGYVRTYLERDLQDLSSIDALPDFRRLMRVLCLRLGGLMNQSEVGRDVGLTQPTVHRYINLLETSYLLIRLPAYSSNRTVRLVKSPKIYWGDVGLSLFLAGESVPKGVHLENIVLNDILVWKDALLDRVDVFHWRTQTGEEVDLVIESSKGILPIEIKSGARPNLGDSKHLRSFRRSQKQTVRSGLLLHAGENLEWIAPDVLSAPWWMIV